MSLTAARVGSVEAAMRDSIEGSDPIEAFEGVAALGIDAERAASSESSGRGCMSIHLVSSTRSHQLKMRKRDMPDERYQ